MLKFVAAYYSPWSERARWALDHHGLAYRETAYTPMLGEPWLRLRIRKFRGPVSIPVLFADGEIVRESVEIARWADRAAAAASGGGGGAPPLFPAGEERAVDAWVRRADALMEAGRVLSVPRVMGDGAARRESLPAAIPGVLRGVLEPMARMGGAYLSRKYALHDRDPIAAESAIRAVLGELRAALSGSRTHLVGDGLTFADVAMAAALMFVRPVDHPAVPLGPGLRAAYTSAALAGEYADLLAWRDRLYTTHRRSPR
jgi:glutathione S-transferase